MLTDATHLNAFALLLLAASNGINRGGRSRISSVDRVVNCRPRRQTGYLYCHFFLKRTAVRRNEGRSNGLCRRGGWC